MRKTIASTKAPMHNVGPAIIYLAATILTGCATNKPAPPAEAPYFYMGSINHYDYFHRGLDPKSKTNYRLERGEVEVGEPFRLTANAKLWRRLEIPKELPATEPARDEKAATAPSQIPSHMGSRGKSK